ncbi:MAG: energy transducer TonB [Gammaproteobacteria bacterium]|nr:energy transducer TonB [Gammaproteobacteria bacterium]
MKKIIIISSAILMSFVLFVLMAELIKNENQAKVESKEPVVITFLPDLKDDDFDTRKRIPPKPPEMEKPVQKDDGLRDPKPDKPKLTDFAFEDFSGIDRGDVATGFEIKNSFDGNGNSARSPKVRINPLYPPEASMKGLEGYVTVAFDIDETGRPFNIRVIEAKPKGVFERSARAAVKKWKYTPEQKEGRAVVVEDEVVMLEFRLEKTVSI